MRLIEILRMIGINLVQNKSKVLLTSLGIIIGTLTIILVIAIGQGGEEQIAAQFSNMSAETIYINMSYSPNLNYETVSHLNEEHLKQIKEENSYLRMIYLRAISYKMVTIKGDKKNFTIVGVTEGYSEISNLLITQGNDFSEEDMLDAKRVVVLGYNIASEAFFEPENAIGEFIRIGDYQYEIIGVLEKKSEGLQGFSPDESIIIPFSTAENNDLFDKYAIPQAVGLVISTKEIKQAINRIQSTLDYMLEDSSMYVIEDAGGRIDAATASARMMKMLLISIATIVFVVGGIGIMNVLFVSVKERTKEIGVLKALGTSKRDILLQFLLESVGIGVFGGIVGVAMSYVALPFMKYTDIPVAASINGQIVALIFAVTTAGLFGFYPAYKASELKPIDALNYE
ncbi:MAG: ABC transporter permease [Firmicutes bacterium HGW-Firmicutes-7]|nr:MAG: ABC transporter permease [Firmicutes bacterium HGW-Firmicutes-7]